MAKKEAMNMEKFFNKIINEICHEKNINVKMLSNDWVTMLEKDSKIRFIVGYKFGIKPYSLGLLFDDKFATYDALSSLNIPVIKHNIYYPDSNKNEYALSFKSYNYLKEIYKKYNNDIVLKINNGSLGNNVYHINDEKSLETIFSKFKNSKSSYSICPFYNIKNEYRSIILDDKVKLLYKKEKPVVIGDGLSTIKELLIKFNKEYYQNYDKENKDEVLKKGEIFEENWQFNLSKGSKSSMEVNNEDKEEILKIVNNIINNIDVGFSSIDIIKTTDNKFYVMEINSGVMMDSFAVQNKDGYAIAKDIYSQAIDKMFK